MRFNCPCRGLETIFFSFFWLFCVLLHFFECFEAMWDATNCTLSCLAAPNTRDWGDRVCQWFVVGRNQKNRFCMKLRVSEGNCIFMYFAGVQNQLWWVTLWSVTHVYIYMYIYICIYICIYIFICVRTYVHTYMPVIAVILNDYESLTDRIFLVMTPFWFVKLLNHHCSVKSSFWSVKSTFLLVG